MPEYFEISFVTPINELEKNKILNGLKEKLYLEEGQNIFDKHTHPFLAGKKILLSVYQHKQTNFYEWFISVPDCLFRKQYLSEDLQKLDQIVKIIFETSKHITNIFCSYEVNAYYLSQIHDINEINDIFLSQFPLVYTRNIDNNFLLHTHFHAQDIFYE